MVPITIGDTVIHPEDFVFGDCDGVVIVPRELTTEVLVKTEEIVTRESGMRADLARGITVSEVYKTHGKF
jgi:regulator of RNase E activity RraA